MVFMLWMDWMGVLSMLKLLYHLGSGHDHHPCHCGEGDQHARDARLVELALIFIGPCTTRGCEVKLFFYTGNHSL